MKVSFDLDDTIFVAPHHCKTEKELFFPLNKIFKERLRYGTISLFKSIKERGIALWIYTTSFRSQGYIKALFRCYGLKIDDIVNGYRHAEEVQGSKSEAMPSKCPNRYRIDLHIDDDISVMRNGEIYGFRVLIVELQDDAWVKKILDAIDTVSKKQQH